MDYKQIFKREVYVVTFGIIIVGIILFGASYAIFMTEVTSNDNLITTGDIDLEFINGKPLVNKFYPMSDIEGLSSSGNEYLFSITNNGNYESKYNITIKNTATNSVDLSYIKFRYNDGEIMYLTDCLVSKGKYVIKSDYLDKGENLDNQVLKLWVGLRNNKGVDFDFNNLGKEIKLEIGIDGDVSSKPSIYKESLLNGNDPVINNGLVPVVIDNKGVVRKADIYSKWYKYEDKEWANAVSVNLDSLRDSKAGTEIPLSNIVGMYVWIPRYAYETESIIDANHAIDVDFVGTSSVAHSAFRVGDTELNGLWVGKFEIGGEYVIKPNVNSLNNESVSSMFNNIKRINNTNGFNDSSDIHMILNTEWGSVAYLTQSIYGVCSGVNSCKKVENNSYYNSTSNDIITGCGGSDSKNVVSVEGLDICPIDNRWNTELGMKASTTRNITGVYDMAGGRAEYVMGSMLTSNGDFYPRLSGFSEAPNLKYFNSYKYGSTNSDYTRGIEGDATIELKVSDSKNPNWNGDAPYFIFSNYGWFQRGGHANNGSAAGIWNFGVGTGGASANSTRAVVWSY